MKKFAFTRLVVAYGFSLMFCCVPLYGKAVLWSEVKVDPQHENQLFFVSVITQAKTVNS